MWKYHGKVICGREEWVVCVCCRPECWVQTERRGAWGRLRNRQHPNNPQVDTGADRRGRSCALYPIPLTNLNTSSSLSPKAIKYLLTGFTALCTRYSVTLRSVVEEKFCVMKLSYFFTFQSTNNPHTWERMEPGLKYGNCFRKAKTDVSPLFLTCSPLLMRRRQLIILYSLRDTRTSGL